jgi:hypothetical protein
MGMRILKAFFAVVLSASFLSGCGGGDALDSLTGGSSGSGGSGGPNSDQLYAAYDKIEEGMSYEQVKNIVGYENNAGKSENTYQISYHWQTDGGVGYFTQLIVTIDAAGTQYKLVSGNRGLSSKSYR